MHNAHMIAHGFVGVGTHNALVPAAPSPIPTPSMPHLSTTTLVNLTIDAKFSKTELGAGGFPLVARGNDSGKMVPHVFLSAPNLLLPVIIALGSSKVMFGSSLVKINAGGAQDCGCCLPPFIPLSPNLACNDPCSYPSDFVIAPNTVMVAMTLGDLLGGLFSMVVEIGVSFAVGKVAGKLSGAAQNFMARHFCSEGTEAFTRTYWEFAAEGFGDQWARLAGRNAAREAAEQAVERLGTSAVGESCKTLVDEFVFKPIVSAGANPIAAGILGGKDDPTEAAHAAASGGGSAADPPIYDTSNPESNPNVYVKDGLL